MRATFLGHSCWGIELANTSLVIDPYGVSEDAEEAIREFASQCEFVLATHGAADHLGIAFDLIRENLGATLISEPAVIRAARDAGLPSDRTDVIFWNAERVYGDLHVRAVETRHISAFAVEGTDFITGMPLAFVVSHDADEVSLLHLGDTSIFSDLALVGQLYRPTVALVGVGAARGFLPEMTPQEAALACLWLRADVALPMHFEESREPADQFCSAVEGMPSKISTWVPAIFESVRITRETRVERSQRSP